MWSEPKSMTAPKNLGRATGKANEKHGGLRTEDLNHNQLYPSQDVLYEGQKSETFEFALNSSLPNDVRTRPPPWRLPPWATRRELPNLAMGSIRAT